MEDCYQVMNVDKPMTCIIHQCVKLTRCFDLFDLQTQEEVYSVQTDPRGVCLIIDCVGTEGGEKSLI